MKNIIEKFYQKNLKEKGEEGIIETKSEVSEESKPKNSEEKKGEKVKKKKKSILESWSKSCDIGKEENEILKIGEKSIKDKEITNPHSYI